MKTTDPTILAAIDSPQHAQADCYTFLLQGGGVYRCTDWQQAITVNGNTFPAAVNIERSKLTQKIGLDVSKVELTLYPKDTDLIIGLPWLQALVQGQLDHATVQIDRAIMTDPSQPPVGSIPMFAGRVADVNVSRSKATLEINSITELLNIQIPRKHFQSGCNNTLFDTHCGLNKEAYRQDSVVGFQSQPNFFYAPLTAIPDRHFDLGSVRFLTGANAGLSRTVKRFVGNPNGNGYSFFDLMQPFPVAPAFGDTFAAYAGCDKNVITCFTKFANQARFRGFPYIPAPTAAV